MADTGNVLLYETLAPGDPEFGDGGLTDAELTALALAADPDRPLDPDAVPLALYPDQPSGGLPSWYMPPAMAPTEYPPKWSFPP